MLVQLLIHSQVGVVRVRSLVETICVLWFWSRHYRATILVEHICMVPKVHLLKVMLIKLMLNHCLLVKLLLHPILLELSRGLHSIIVTIHRCRILIFARRNVIQSFLCALPARFQKFFAARPPSF